MGAKEVSEFLTHLAKGRRWLMAMQLYGGGLRLTECLQQRVKDLDFERLQVIVRDGRGKRTG
jgi:integrase